MNVKDYAPADDGCIIFYLFIDIYGVKWYNFYVINNKEMRNAK